MSKNEDKNEGGLRLRGHVYETSKPGSPLVSIITIVYNGADHLAHTIQSVLGQTYGNIEYIVIDGGSTDGTVDIIKEYEDHIAYWISEPDRGLYDAMNKGVQLSSGDWINFMNAGDHFYRQDTVQRVVNSLDDDVELLYGHCEMVYGPEFSLIWKTKSESDLWKGMIFRHQSLFTRASVCKARPFSLEYRISADFFFIYSSYQVGCVLKPLDLVISSVSAGGVSDANIIIGLKENLHVVAQYGYTRKVRWYYRYLIGLTYLKIAAKKILPLSIQNLVRSLKY